MGIVAKACVQLFGMLCGLGVFGGYRGGTVCIGISNFLRCVGVCALAFPTSLWYDGAQNQSHYNHNINK